MFQLPRHTGRFDHVSVNPSSGEPAAHRRVLFLIPPTGTYCREDRCQSYFSYELVPSMRPPLEECEAAGAVRAAGATPALIDAPAEGLSDDATLHRLVAANPDLVILVVTFGTLDDDLVWAARVRTTLPGITIGVRGAPCYSLADDILQRAPAVDFCVRGEYELIFDEVVRLGHRHAVGTVFRDGERRVAPRPSRLAADLDELPLPDRSILDARRYRVRGLGAPQATVRVQRGCPFPCTYCLVHSVSGDRARHRSPEGIATEIAALQAQGTRYFYLRAETFSLDRSWTLRLCATLAERCPDIRWVTTTRVECVDEAILAAMRRAGCYGISFGIDAGSRRIGDLVRKRPDMERATAALRLCDRHGILSLGYFMLGFVWDDAASIAETGDFIHAVRPDLLTIHFAHPYPGTRYHQQVEEQHLRVISPRAQAEPALALPGWSPEALQREAHRMLRRHYMRPSVVASVSRKLLRLGWSESRLPSLRPLAASAVPADPGV